MEYYELITTKNVQNVYFQNLQYHSFQKHRVKMYENVFLTNLGTIQALLQTLNEKYQNTKKVP